jgi:hypothetical protein
MLTLARSSASADTVRSEIVRALSTSALSCEGDGASYRLAGTDNRPGLDVAIQYPVDRDVGRGPAGSRSAGGVARPTAEPDSSILSGLAAAGRANGPWARRTAIACRPRRHWPAGRTSTPRPAGHLHRVPLSQKVHGHRSIAPPGQRRRQPGDPPPFLRCPTRGGQGVGGEHLAHQVVRADG